MKWQLAGQKADKALDAMIALLEDYNEEIIAIDSIYELQQAIDSINQIRSSLDLRA